MGEIVTERVDFNFRTICPCLFEGILIKLDIGVLVGANSGHPGNCFKHLANGHFRRLVVLQEFAQTEVKRTAVPGLPSPTCSSLPEVNTQREGNASSSSGVICSFAPLSLKTKVPEKQESEIKRICFAVIC